MEQGEPLRISGINKVEDEAEQDIIICDFESDQWPQNWTVSGSAWGKKPTDNSKSRQKADGIIGRKYTNSFIEKGDQGQGEIASPPFIIRRDFISLLVGGGDDGGKARVSLEIDGKEIFSATGKNSWQLHPISWNVKEYKGLKARIRIIDQTEGSWGWVCAEHIVQTNKQNAMPGIFKKSSTKHWSDWMQVLRLQNSQNRYIDATYGHGFPFIWIEFHQLTPLIIVDSNSITDSSGKKINLPHKGNNLVFNCEKRTFAVFAPDKTDFTLSVSGIEVGFNSDKHYLVAAVIPSVKNTDEFQKYAYAIPRETMMSYRYEIDKGRVATEWKIKTEPLRKDATETLQGWLPHHYRNTENNIKFIVPEFKTTRGKMRFAAGNTFQISWKFTGLLPVLPTPQEDHTLPYKYQKSRMEEYVRKWIAERESKPYNGHDTYWGAKEFFKMAQIMALSGELGMPEAKKLENMTKVVLNDWLTYTPGERSRYFAKYPHPWSGLVGFNPSYGSEKFNDNHFHYGYFTLAGALLSMRDRKWGKDFSPMLKLIAKQYANWDRSDKDFPWMRCFDPWNGHCYAGGLSNNNDGNNQESSSESMGAWSGLFLLGNMLEDDDMIAAGAMGWAIESEAIAEYWNDYYAWKLGKEYSNYSPIYKNKHSIISVLRDRDIGYWTWFSGEAVHIYGIQWLPLWTSLQYLGRDSEFSSWQFEKMLQAQGNGKKIKITELGGDWGNIALSPLIFGKSEQAAKFLEETYIAGDKFASFQHATLTYYFAHSMRSLGNVAWNYHTSVPTSTIFQDAQGKLCAVIYNPSNTEVNTNIFRGSAKIATVIAPAGVITKYTINNK